MNEDFPMHTHGLIIDRMNLYIPNITDVTNKNNEKSNLNIQTFRFNHILDIDMLKRYR